MRRLDTPLGDRLGLRFAIVQAPMAGVTTPELVAAVSEAGALGSFGGATSSPDELRAAIRAIRELTTAPFAVNLFAPMPEEEPEAADVEAVRTFVSQWGPPGAAAAPPWSFDDQLAVVIEERVPVLSFTFGLVDPEPVHDVGIATIGTATTAEEARELELDGVDAIVAQGAEAGGHRGTFLDSFDEGLVPLAELVPQVLAAVSKPVIAAGGMMDGAGIAAALDLGAQAVQLGTAFLFAREARVPEAWLQALREHETVVTDAYTGRPARAAWTPFLVELMQQGPPPLPYPLQAAVLAPFRAHDGYGFYMGGTGASRGREAAAGELVRTLAFETESAGRSA
ncbi:MAG TPA: nitronate monooxygenase [Gaiellaceae bacterium]|nr:nitronate monooxygenase [Gaiellaceae bacterium]